MNISRESPPVQFNAPVSASTSPARSTEPAALSCVLDDTPGIWSSFLPWLTTAMQLGRIPPNRIHVHHVCPLRADVQLLCNRFDVQTRPVLPFDARSPHSNKIRQLTGNFGGPGYLILTDVDTAFVARLPLDEIRVPVAGKLVDYPNPPIEVLETVFHAAGLKLPKRHKTSYQSDGKSIVFETFVGNFNGGLYLVRQDYARELGEAWAKWGGWLQQRLSLLDEWRINADQVAFCLALQDLGLPAQVLNDRWNHPTHVETPATDQEPYLLHHHVCLDDHQRLLPTGGSGTQRAIRRVNRLIESFQRQYFDNQTFWEHRYAHHPERGSGMGSRGDVLALKQNLIRDILPPESSLSILDWGCGDLEIIRSFPWRDYTGVDISSSALAIARAKRPDWNFMTAGQFNAHDQGQRDLVICLDVLIHQPTHEEYLAMLEKIIGLAKCALLVSGYNEVPEIASHITYHHEPLADTLTRHKDIQSVHRLTEYRDTAMYIAVKNSPPDDLSGAIVQGNNDSNGALGRVRTLLRRCAGKTA